MNWLTIIQSLLPLLAQNAGAQGADAAELAEIALKLIERIKSQSGMTTQQILDRAGLTLQENKIRLAEDMARLNAGSGSGTGSGGASGTGGGSGAGGSGGGGTQP
ncbi:MAG: hypothetical protein QOJ76_1430 [Acidobacteriota bacterium]|jgi:uncharacterized membrane protein YgcG|nr:hypothetical protein [Acidobacteriota bacterium]